MKKLQLDDLSVVELNKYELKQIEGGNFWKWLGSAFAYLAFGFGLGSSVLDSGSFEF